MVKILIALTICIPWLGALIVWWVGDRHEKLQHILAVAFSVLSGVTSVLLLLNSGIDTVTFFSLGDYFGDVSFVPNGLGVFLSTVATVIGSLAVIFSTNYMKGEASLGRYYGYVLFFIGSMVGLVLTNNILLMFVFWEFTALCSYALIAFHNDDPKAVAGGVKALLITSIGGVGLLVGGLIIFVYTGSYDIDKFLAGAGNVPANILGLLAFGFLIAAAAKSAQFPFQTWLPDAMEAPSPISALIHAATMVNAGVYLLARFYPAFQNVPYWREAVMAVGMISALLAAIMALTAWDIKRVLAYSTISQLGYMVYAIGAGNVYASQFHLLSHSVFKALLFLGAGAVIHNIGTRDMHEMGGVGRKMPFVQWVFIIGALALAGIPIFNGFWSKELILEAGLQGGPTWMYVVMLAVAGLTALYTIRLVYLVFYGEPRSEYHVHSTGTAMKVALAPLAFGAFTTWLLAGQFSQLLGESTLPFHKIEPFGLPEMFHEVLSIPTLIALAVIALGVVLWLIRDRLAGLTHALEWLRKASVNSFGFEWVNRAIVKGTQATGEGLRVTQTGVLGWNVLAILVTIILLFAIYAVGA
jgi:NADH-quinone oxidoreductase subunit L